MEHLAGRIVSLSGWRRALVAFLAGAVAVLTQAPYDVFAAGFLAFPVLVWLLDGATADDGAGFLRRLKPAFAVGWWFGFGYFLVGLWWIGGAVLVEADSFAWALPFAVVGIPLILSFFYAFAAVLGRLLWSGGIGRIAALAFAFGLTEWLRGFLFTGFPWNPIGLAGMPFPLLMQSVVLTGVFGMSALAVFVFAMPALLISPRHRNIGLAAALILVAAHVGYGAWRINAPEPEATSTVQVRIVQPNVDLSVKWDGSVRDEIFAGLLKATTAAPVDGASRPDLIVWPETSVPFLFSDRPDALSALGDALQDGQLLYAGAVRMQGGSATEEGLYYNSVVAINDRGEIVDAVDKVHLVPFGEYIPFADWMSRIGLNQLVAGPMTFSAGDSRHALAVKDGVTAAPFICYEIIFPELVDAGARDSNLIVNVTNDAWFGDTPGPYQHFRQAQIRAVETGLPVLRSANTGISGVIDAKGRIVDALALNVLGTVDVAVPVRQSTVRVNPHVNAVLIILAFAVIAIGMRVSDIPRLN